MTPDELKKRRHRNERIAAALIVLIAAALTSVLIHRNRLLEKELRAKPTYVPRQTVMTPEAELLQQYVRIDTSNPPGNERRGADFLARILRSNGIVPEIIESAPGRANLYARIKGSDPGDGLLLLHHIDVVPADPNGWTKAPFSGDIYLNQIYGRGTLDMKGIGICQLVAFLDVAKSGRIPNHDIVFLAVADEETGSSAGMGWLMAHRPDVIAGIRYAINEGGITEVEEEKLIYFGIETGTKQVVSVMVRAASRDQLRNLRLAMEPMFFSREPGRILPEVRQFMKALAPQRQAYRQYLADIDGTIARGRFWILPAGYRELTQNVVWADGVTRAGDQFQMRVVLANLPDENPDTRLTWLRRFIAPYGAEVATVIRKEGPVPITSIDTPFFRLIEREVHATYGPQMPVGPEILNRSFNDSRFLRVRGIDAYGMYPYPVDFFQTQGVHGIDERVRVDWFVEGVALMRRVVGGWAFGG